MKIYKLYYGFAFTVLLLFSQCNAAARLTAQCRACSRAAPQRPGSRRKAQAFGSSGDKDHYQEVTLHINSI